MFSEEVLYSIALRNCKFIGDLNFGKLVKTAGSAKEVWELSKSGLRDIKGIGKEISREIGKEEHLRFAEKEIDFCIKNKILVRLRHLNELPKLLDECYDAPAILYQKGSWDESLSHLSIVGTRNATDYGRKFIKDFLSVLRGTKTITISGLALGVDACVHEASLVSKIPTVGVLAHGFHTFYPKKNKILSEKILDENGTLITEFNSSQNPERENFIQRNRIIAGLSPTTIVVETAYGGGAVSTAGFANGYDREVFALPGRVTDKYSQGCNHLIEQNKARIVSSFKDIINQLGFDEEQEIKDHTLILQNDLSKLNDKEKMLYCTISSFPNISLDDLAERSNLATHEILPVLLELEISGLIKSLSARQYVAV